MQEPNLQNVAKDFTLVFGEYFVYLFSLNNNFEYTTR